MLVGDKCFHRTSTLMAHRLDMNKRKKVVSLRPRRPSTRAVIVAGLLIGAAIGLLPGVMDLPAQDLPATPDTAADLEGTVTHVRDGDTIEIGDTAIRLSGLHAPEMDEAGGPAARAFMVDLVEGKRVQCQLEGRRSYDREIGTCALDGDDIAGLLIAAGLGRDCPRFSGGRYADLETNASRELRLPRYCVPRN